VDDYFELLFYYERKRVRIKSSYIVREALPGYIFHGLKGSFIKPKTDVQEEMLQAGNIPGGVNWGKESESQRGLLHTEKNGEEIKEYIKSEQGNYNEYYDGIYEAIRNNKRLPVTAEEGVNVIKIIEAAYKSNETKKVVNL
jgi:scyllo-inositol 2-dehydrogenase (NADP+)